jgi:hypothetical protein
MLNREDGEQQQVHAQRYRPPDARLRIQSIWHGDIPDESDGPEKHDKKHGVAKDAINQNCTALHDYLLLQQRVFFPRLNGTLQCRLDT